jgi:hypothetical protein
VARLHARYEDLQAFLRAEEAARAERLRPVRVELRERAMGAVERAHEARYVCAARALYAACLPWPQLRACLPPAPSCVGCTR